MSAGTVVAGIIALFLGLAGLLELYGRPILPFSLAIVGTFVTLTGAWILFGAIAVVGIALIIGGAVSEGPKTVVVQPGPAQVVAPVVVTPSSPGVSPAPPDSLSELDLVTLRYLSEGKDDGDVAKSTGVAKSTISEKMARLHAHGYITEKHQLTEKGYEALRQADQTIQNIR